MDKVQGAAFKAKRKADKLSAQKLADKLGTTRENVYKWEGGTVPKSKAMQKKVRDYINGAPIAEKKPGVKKVKPKVSSSSNGTVPHEDFREKYYTLLEKYTALLEKKP